jgi:hypothetical protein
VGSIPHESKVIPMTDNCIRPAPRALGLRRKRQCGVPFSYEERLKINRCSGRRDKEVLGRTLNCLILEGRNGMVVIPCLGWMNAGLG